MSHVELYREVRINVNGQGDPLEDFYKPSKWRWRYVASNGRVMADSGQGYARRVDCLNGCATVLGAEITEGGNLKTRHPESTRYIEVRDLTREGKS